MTDFANILFAGPCNRDCPFCIGRALPDAVNIPNLDLFPPRGIEEFVSEINRRGVREIVFTGTTTDPQLYRFEAELLSYLRARIKTGARYAVHTNGVRALARVETFNRYDKACISFPSFVPETYERMMGSWRVPDLEKILAAARIPVKVSCVLTEDNAPEIDSFIARCRAIGVRRLVIRRIYGDRGDRGDRSPWRVLADRPARTYYRNNPVFDFDGMEVTRWDFDDATSTSLNLFADGTIGTSYLLARTPEFESRGAALPAPAA